MIRRRTLAVAIAGLVAGALPAAHATDYEVTVTNLTSGVHFTPLVLAAHPESASVFASGMPASEELRAVAEGGDTMALAASLESIGAAVTLDDTLLAPGETRTFLLSDGGDPANTRLSIAGMLLPTNDGFVGLDSLVLPGDGASDTASSDVGALDVDGGADGGVDGDGMAIDDGTGATSPSGEEPAPLDPADGTAFAPPDPFGEPAPLDEVAVEEMPADEVPLEEMSQDELFQDEMSQDEISRDEPLDTGPTTDVPDDAVADAAPGEIAPIDGLPAMDDDASVTVELLGYDAGTEANDEVLGSGAVGEPGFPAPQPVVDSGTGTGASGIGAPIESFVHVHRGVQGDNDPAGGVSDINAAVHGWMNPVARVTVSIASGVPE